MHKAQFGFTQYDLGSGSKTCSIALEFKRTSSIKEAVSRGGVILLLCWRPLAIKSFLKRFHQEPPSIT